MPRAFPGPFHDASLSSLVFPSPQMVQSNDANIRVWDLSNEDRPTKPRFQDISNSKVRVHALFHLLFGAVLFWKLHALVWRNASVINIGFWRKGCCQRGPTNLSCVAFCVIIHLLSRWSGFDSCAAHISLRSTSCAIFSISVRVYLVGNAGSK